MKMENQDSLNKFGNTLLSPHMEDYLETIGILSQKNNHVRVKDIADEMNIKMPSVTAALQKLNEMALVNYEKYKHVELTEEGKKLAGQIYMRHQCLTQFFQDVLHLNNEDAETEACKVEHVLQPETCERISTFINFYEEKKHNNEEWIKEWENKIS